MLMVHFILPPDECSDTSEKYDSWALWNCPEFIGAPRPYDILEEKHWNYWFSGKKNKFMSFRATHMT